MIFRTLLRYLTNNERLIQRMANSYPMRRAARLVISVMYRAKDVAYENRLHKMSPECFKRFMQAFKSNIKEEIEDAKGKLKKRKY